MGYDCPNQTHNIESDNMSVNILHSDDHEERAPHDAAQMVATKAREKAQQMEHELRELKKLAKFAEAGVEFGQATRQHGAAAAINNLILKLSRDILG